MGLFEFVVGELICWRRRHMYNTNTGSSITNVATGG